MFYFLTIQDPDDQTICFTPHLSGGVKASFINLKDIYSCSFRCLEELVNFYQQNRSEIQFLVFNILRKYRSPYVMSIQSGVFEQQSAEELISLYSNIGTKTQMILKQKEEFHVS